MWNLILFRLNCVYKIYKWLYWFKWWIQFFGVYFFPAEISMVLISNWSSRNLFSNYLIIAIEIQLPNGNEKKEGFQTYFYINAANHPTTREKTHFVSSWLNTNRIIKWFEHHFITGILRWMHVNVLFYDLTEMKNK